MNDSGPQFPYLVPSPVPFLHDLMLRWRSLENSWVCYPSFALYPPVMEKWDLMWGNTFRTGKLKPACSPVVLFDWYLLWQQVPEWLWMKVRPVFSVPSHLRELRRGFWWKVDHWAEINHHKIYLVRALAIFLLPSSFFLLSFLFSS